MWLTQTDWAAQEPSPVPRTLWRHRSGPQPCLRARSVGVVLVPAPARDELLEAIDAGALVLIPEAARQDSLAVVAVLFPEVRRHALLGEEVLGADLGPAVRATREVHVEALGDLLPSHTLSAVHDVCLLVLQGGEGVVHRVLGLVVGLDGAAEVVDGLHAGRVVAAARRRQATLVAPLEVLPASCESVDLHGVDVDGPRDGGVIWVAGAGVHAFLHQSRGRVQGLVDAAHRARPLADLALILAGGGGQET